MKEKKETGSKFITVKTTVDNLTLLRLAAAMSGEHQHEVLSRLLNAELERLKSIPKNDKK